LSLPRVAFVTVHGMGKTHRNYADAVWSRLKAGLGADAADFAFEPAFYQDILQPNQDLVWNRTRAMSNIHYDNLRQFVLFGFGDAAGLENRKEFDGSSYELAQLEIARALLLARERCGAFNVPLVLLAHSLGCQVLSSYIYDAQKARKIATGAAPPGSDVRAGIWKDDIQRFALAISGRPTLSDDEIAFLRCDTCTALLTTGCNIPVFVAAHKNMDIIPIDPPNGGDFAWINVYDPDDVLGWPLEPLSDRYRNLVEDRTVNAGRGMVDWILKSWNPLSHELYWDDPEVLDLLRTLLLSAAR
jgi:hypothetical protein